MNLGTDMSADRNANSSRHLLERELVKKGYVVTGSWLGGRRTVRYTSPAGRTFSTFAKHVSYPLSNSFVKKVSTDKTLAYEFASSLGITVPPTLTVTSINAAALAFLREQGRIVAKPLAAFASRGVTLDITDEETLRGALVHAQKFGTEVILQRQIDGEEVRVIVLGGNCIGAMARRKPAVTGDGVTTLAGLIDAENKARLEINLPYSSYPQLSADSFGLNQVALDRVIPNGESIQLSHATTIEKGASIVNVSDSLDRSYAALAERYAREIGSDFIVVDFLITDMRAAASQRNYCFLETNMSPELKFFYADRYGNYIDIVPPLADTIDKRIHL